MQKLPCCAKAGFGLSSKGTVPMHVPHSQECEPFLLRDQHLFSPVTRLVSCCSVCVKWYLPQVKAVYDVHQGYPSQVFKIFMITGSSETVAWIINHWALFYVMLSVKINKKQTHTQSTSPYLPSSITWLAIRRKVPLWSCSRFLPITVSCPYFLSGVRLRLYTGV